MDDEKLKRIVKETIKVEDPFWINETYEVIKKLISLPDGAEFTIRQLVDNDQAPTNYLSSIYKNVTQVCEKISISINSKNKGAIVGMPWNATLIKNSDK